MKTPSRSKLLAAVLVGAAGLLSAEVAYAIDAETDRILRAMGEYLKSANEFSFHADITYDAVLSTGEKVQYGGASEVSVRRWCSGSTTLPARIRTRFVIAASAAPVTDGLGKSPPKA